MLLPRTIRVRVFLGSVLAIVAAFAVVALTIPTVAREHEIEVLGARLASDATLAADLARDGFRANDANTLDALARRIAASAQLRVTFVGVDGTVLGESDEDRRRMENHAQRPEVIPALAGREGRTVRQSATLGRDLLYVAVPVRDGERVIGVSRVALPLLAVDALAARLAASLVAGAVAAALAALALSYVVTRAITRPIERITEAAEREGDADIGDVRGPEEVQRLAAALRRASASVRGERQAAQAERDHLATLIDQLGDAIFIADREGRVELANAAARRSAGDDVVGRRLVEVIREHEALEAIAATRDGHERVAIIERSDPRRFLRVVARPLPSQAGGELLVVVQDLTNLRRLETMRSDFVANVSHELRRPISSLKAMAETLEEGALEDPAAARDFVARMHREIDGLAQLVNELLALTRIESGAEPLSLERCSPAQLLDECARRMGALASRAGVALFIETTTASDVRADAGRIGQVLSNLVHNAVKFTPSGGSIRLAAEDQDDAVLFSVSDSGAGIEAADLERVFERLYKTDRARSG
ncbi:MAG: histidine kinase dimerization/phospho-acceptor domain-containing protein, partial [Candidatus Limnocylindria bacterium]|nr:histidine kinase dimerization/phospho-acceptor domain-containing protein [Candidatus Limnocylindria bacterium]